MSQLDIATAPTTDTDRSLLLPTALLLVAQIIHILIGQLTDTPQAHHAGPGRVLHIVGVVVTIGVVVGAIRRARWAAPATAVIGAGGIVAITVLHLLPVDNDLLSPYWGEATTIQWLGLVIVLAAGAAAAVSGARATSALGG